MNPPKVLRGPAPDRASRESLESHLIRIEGQLRGIQRMVENSRSCVEVIQQMSAVQAAVGRVMVEVFRLQVEATMGPDAPGWPDHDGRQALDEILDLVEQYSTLAKLARD